MKIKFREAALSELYERGRTRETKYKQLCRNEKLVPARLIHPGEILREELQERGISQKDFAGQIGVHATHLNEFIKGKRDLNENLAMKLEKHLGIPYKVWMNLHNGYIYDKKTIEGNMKDEQAAAEYETACSSIFNINILYKKLGITDTSCKRRVSELKKSYSFDLLSSAELREHVAGLYKHSDKVPMDDKNLLTWLLLNVKAIESCDMPASPYKKGDGNTAAIQIAEMANNRSLSVDKIKSVLSDNGIAYVKVPKIDKVPVDAYSTCKGGCPIITVTYRYDDMDKLAFDILHELYHIDNHLSADAEAFISVEGTEYSTDPKEKEANEYARRTLIPDEKWDKIMSAGSNSLSPYRIVNIVAKKAKEYGISPSIAVARYKHDANWYRTSSFKSPKIK